MDYDHLRPKTLRGIKNLAKTLKKRDGIPHAQALEAAARQAGWDCYERARQALAERDDVQDDILPGSAFADLLRKGEVA